MGSFLHKLGLWAYKHKWLVVVSWLVILVILGIAAAHFMKPTSGAISIPGTEAQKTADRFNQLFPKAGAQSGKIVVATPSGKTVQDFKDQITSLASIVTKVPEVTGVVSPFDNPTAISPDKTVAYLVVQLKPTVGGSITKEDSGKIDQAVQDSRTDGLTVEYGGDIINQAPGEILGVGEIAGVVLALVILVLTLGSFVAAGMPIITALVAVIASMAGLFSLSQVVEIGSTTPVLAVMLGLAVGIDYSLFIVNRYRTFVHEGYGLQRSAGKAIATAGNAVLFAATTVVIALAALTIVQIPFITTMGLAAAGAVALTAIIAVTLIPALLGIAGTRTFGRRDRERIKKEIKARAIHEEVIHRKTIWYHWSIALLRFRFPILIVALAVVAVIAWPARELTLGLPTDETAAPASTQRKTYDLLVKGFGAGFNAPLLVVVEGLPAVSDADKSAIRQQAMAVYDKKVAEATAVATAKFQQELAKATTPAAKATLQAQAQVEQQQGTIQQQAALVAIEKQVQQNAPYYQLNLVAQQIAKVNDVKQALPILTTDNGTKGAIQVIPNSGPSDKKTADLVVYLRDPDHQNTITKSDSVKLNVTGTAAVQMDINAKVANALPVYLAVVVGLSFIILMVAFRSILVPIKATLGFLLSVGAMFGAVVAVFQLGWFGISNAPGPIVSFIPVISIGILFGLAMDYEFFLVSGMQEAYHKDKNARKAIVHGFNLGSKVVVAAGLIMVSVFAGFATNTDATVQSIGFGLAVGILVDAFIVRLTIVPILMSLLGKSAWWLPKWLDRILPNISIEGEETK